MGWDISFFRRAPHAKPRDMDDWLPLGTFDSIVAKLTPCLGNPTPAVSGFWIVQRDGCELNIKVHDEHPVTSVSLGVFGRGNPFPSIRIIAAVLECEALDMVNLELIDLNSNHSDGWNLQKKTEGLFALLRKK